MRPSEIATRFEAAWDAFRGHQTRNAYIGAEMSRLNGDWIVAPLTSDRELINDLPRLRTRCRDLARNNPLATRFTSLCEENMIGPNGIAMQGKIKTGTDANKTANDLLEYHWQRYCESVTVDGRFSMVDLCHLLARSVPTDGEIFIRKRIGRQYPYGLGLELIDPDLLNEGFNMGPDRWRGRGEVRLSVEVDQDGRRIGYWISPQPDSSGYPIIPRYFVAAREIIHLGCAQRINQTRFVPWFHPVMGEIKMLDGLAEAELVASRAAAAKMMWLVNKEGGGTFGTKDKDGNKTSIPMEATPGGIGIAPPGYDIASFDPQHPTTAFGVFHDSIVRRISAGLGISFTALANNPGDANFSAGRDERQREQRFWRKKQGWFVRGFLQNVFEEWLGTAALTGMFDLGYGVDPEQASHPLWLTPGWDYVAPKEDAEAAILLINNNLDTPQRILGERGRDWESEVVEPLKEAKRILKAAGLEVVQPAPTAGFPPRAGTPTNTNGDGPKANGKGTDAGAGQDGNQVATAAA
jgi:lambda family phage portal protein